VTWDYLPRRTEWGRTIVAHTWDHDRAGEHHGGAGIFAPILQRLKMLVRYDSAELEAAIINAIFAAYVKSPFDPQMVQEALDPGHEEDTYLGMYQDQRAAFAKERGPMVVGDSKMTYLFPGEEIGQVKAERPAGNYAPFTSAVLRHAARGMGLTYEQLTGDFSQTNFSSFRGATNEVKKTMDRRAANFDKGFVLNIRTAAVEEFMDVEDIPLPGGAPAFEDFRLAYSNCKWLRPGRGWINPLDEIRASGMAMQYGLSTLEDQAAEASGQDWEEILDQRGLEISRFKEKGIPVPEIYMGKDAPPPDGGKIGSGG
jgi:lambda family phage portal protein